MHLNGGGVREKKKNRVGKREKRGGVGEDGTKKHREAKRDNKAAGKKVSFRQNHLFLLEMEYIKNHAATVCTVSCEIKPVIKKNEPCGYLMLPLPRLPLTSFYLRACKQRRHKPISRFLSFTLIGHQTCWTYLHQTCVTKHFYQFTEKTNLHSEKDTTKTMALSQLYTPFFFSSKQLLMKRIM